MDRAAPLTLHTGEVIAVLTRAKLPQVFRDDGAFDAGLTFHSKVLIWLVPCVRLNYWS
jgi:hypothetical protein